jgi:hypothetical protein
VTGEPTSDEPSAAEVVMTRLEPLVLASQTAATELTDHPEIAAIYPELVRMMHWTIRASVPLLRAAEAEALRLAAAGDPVAAALVRYLRHHVTEELHHDDWLLADYAALGLDRADILDSRPSATVAELVGAVYYWILHYHPVAILGHLAVREGVPPSAALIERLQQRTGYPPEAFGCLRHHAVIDPDHDDELWDLIDDLPLTSAQLDLIVEVGAHSVILGDAAIGDVTRTSPPQP